MQDFEEEGQWCDKKQAICSANITDMDLRAMTSLQQKHKALEDEMVWRHQRFMSGSFATGHDMIQRGHPLVDQIQDRVRVVQGKWAMLREEADKRSVKLESITLAKSKVREDPVKNVFDYFDILGLWARET